MKTKPECPLASMADEISEICSRTFQKAQPDGTCSRTFHVPLIANLDGELDIFPSVPRDYQIGLFSKPGKYPVTARFSNSFFSNEYYPDARGMALKIRDVDGPVCEDAPAGEHNITLLNQPTFIARHGEDMLAFVRKMDGVKGITPFNIAPPTYTFPGWNPARARWGFVKGLLYTVFQSMRYRDLAQYRYYSVAPYRLGEGAMKYRFSPASRPLGQGRTLRERLHSHLLKAPLAFDFFIQPKTLETDWVDDLFQEWKSPSHLVGRLTFPAHDIFKAAIFEDGEKLSYNPWHCLKAHEPLGSINALRRVAYRDSGVRRGAIFAGGPG
jgi:hypothetical protein